MEQAKETKQDSPIGVAKIKCFRGVKEVKLELAPITILTGRNNAGKSSVLEALALAFSAPSLQDWLGNDIARMIIDDKLAGHPSRLLNLTCREEATINLNLKMDDQGARIVRIAKPNSTINNQFLCMMLQKIRESLYDELTSEGEAYRCLRKAFASYTREGEALTTIMFTIGYIIAHLAESTCEERLSIEKIVQPILLPESLARSIYKSEPALKSAALTLREHVNRIIRPIIDDSIVIKLNGSSYLYLPRFRMGVSKEKQYYEELSNLEAVFVRNIINMTGIILERAELKDLYSVYAKLQLGKELGKMIRRCIWKKLRRTIDNLWTAQYRVNLNDGKANEKTEWNVYTVFRRSTVIRHEIFGANTLEKIVDKVHDLGLLRDYGNVIRSIRSLNLEDPIIKENEVLLRKDGMRIPAALLGDGTLLLLALLAGLVLARRQPQTVLILEEPETGLHPGYLMVLADSIARATKENPSALVLLSTHSMELIRFIAKRAMRHGVLDKVKTVLMSNGEVYSVFKGREILEAKEIGIELRGI
ncbi:AAA family ATPase [Pyrodictium abyssi]|uniref:Endonuclease GajA/Old nuclease/RecF-like AAA domain-containing protein n=1 Tax=Pyrodictium abyssi TaxID=54256 RepID=A0ABM8IVZ4_9CREN|nr:hypothetical protein PABY_13010 [Pyrodictium abyssi]